MNSWTAFAVFLLGAWMAALLTAAMYPAQIPEVQQLAQAASARNIYARSRAPHNPNRRSGPRKEALLPV
ncbi:MAG TPA: hypothetical protein VEG68_19870 [Terriglobales bacterium]|nr:hypothetical protein [Terriglobales bacterium]